MVETQITVTQAEPIPKSSLIVVSNRLPFVLKRNAKTGELTRQARYVVMCEFCVAERNRVKMRNRPRNAMR